MVTIHRRLYSGSGWPLTTPDGTPITQEITVDSLDQAIYDLLTEVRAVLGGPGSTITQLLGASAEQQQQIAVYSRGAAAVGMLASLVAPEVGIPVALGAEIVAIANEFDLTGDVEAPDEMPQNTIQKVVDGTYPVTPVTPPPTGYGGEDAATIVAAIFDHAVTWQNATGEVQLGLQEWLVEVMAALAPLAWATGLPDPRNPYFALVASYPSAIPYGALLPWAANAIPPVPALDFTAVLTDDTVLSYLNREQAGYTWTMQGPWGEGIPAGVYAALSGEYAGRYWRCLLTDEQLHLLAGHLGGGATNVPPVWPGLAGVTLGAPVEVTESQIIDGPMDGINLTVDAVDAGTGKWGITGRWSYYRAGYVQFINDGGGVETIQYMGSDEQTFCPHSMQRAASVLIFLSHATQVTVTPWTLAG